MQVSLGSPGIFNKDVSPITSRINKLNNQVSRVCVTQYFITSNKNSTSESKSHFRHACVRLIAIEFNSIQVRRMNLALVSLSIFAVVQITWCWKEHSKR